MEPYQQTDEQERRKKTSSRICMCLCLTGCLKGLEQQECVVYNTVVDIICRGTMHYITIKVSAAIAPSRSKTMY